MENLEWYEKFKTVPENAQKPIEAGRLKGKTDINPMWRLKVLTEQFGPCGIGWYYETTRKWIEESGQEAAAFVDIKLYVKVDGEWSKPIEGTGGSMLRMSESKGLRTSDECYKMATTDALSVACKQLGIGASIYWNESDSKYAKKTDTDTPAQSIIKQIESICKKHGTTPEDICKGFGVKWHGITNTTAGQMLAYLKQTYKDE